MCWLSDRHTPRATRERRSAAPVTEVGRPSCQPRIPTPIRACLPGARESCVSSWSAGRPRPHITKLNEEHAAAPAMLGGLEKVDDARKPGATRELRRDVAQGHLEDGGHLDL